jgi:hypothetical protein
VDPLLAEVDLAAKAGKYVLYVLAVAGGFLLGNVLTLLICRIIAKLALKTKINQRLEQALRILGGIAVAILVGYLLFQNGLGWGFGGTGQGKGEQTGGNNPKETDPTKESRPKVEPKPKDEEAILASGIKVTILRGASFPKSFRFEGEADGVDLATAKDKLRQRKDASKDRLKFMDIVIYKNSTAEGHPMVVEFENFAHDLGLRTSRQKLDQTLPE